MKCVFCKRDNIKAQQWKSTRSRIFEVFLMGICYPWKGYTHRCVLTSSSSKLGAYTPSHQMMNHHHPPIKKRKHLNTYYMNNLKYFLIYVRSSIFDSDEVKVAVNNWYISSRTWLMVRTGFQSLYSVFRNTFPSVSMYG